jgi:glucokinase-like ROK family protein
MRPKDDKPPSTTKSAGRSANVDQVQELVRLLSLVRSESARTRRQLGQQTGLGRSVVTERVKDLINLGLVAEGHLGRSTGGRAPRELQFCSDGGFLLVAELGATGITAGIADLNGSIIEHRDELSDITDGPDIISKQLEELFDDLITHVPGGLEAIWGVGIGVPGPVEFATGRPVSPPIMPGWDGYDIRGRFAARYDAPVWVDNEVNLMALGELRSRSAQETRDLVYLKVGSSIGAGLVSGGKLHRGAQGCAGDIGHIAVTDADDVICRCGNSGCLAAVAGGRALGLQAAAALEAGSSPFLLHRVNSTGRPPTARDVADGALHGDATCLALINSAATHVGRVLAQLVNIFNPSIIVIGGGVAEAREVFLAPVRRAIYARSLPLATRDLRIVWSPLAMRSGLIGAAAMVVDELFRPERLALWSTRSPHGYPQLAESSGDDGAPREVFA